MAVWLLSISLSARLRTTRVPWAAYIEERTMEEKSVSAGRDGRVAELKATIARYEELRSSTQLSTAAVTTAGCRLRAMIMTKQLISAEPSELLEAAYDEATIILGLLEDLSEALAAFDSEA